MVLLVLGEVTAFLPGKAWPSHSISSCDRSLLDLYKSPVLVTAVISTVQYYNQCIVQITPKQKAYIQLPAENTYHCILVGVFRGVV